ncbi:signal transduction histidine kinase [Fontibacillus phaseoli]|uniref:histidine kinase n=1 Tax=Fontibacillus phaseoli TaxID=1416533 RepID=A0A369BJU9_9BACL|nr:ATP-binding protein [Fontibacillus phaseoli]RCX21405.1 signal transduction histidine kinase [Fontibacillus phaseoli]
MTNSTYVISKRKLLLYLGLFLILLLSLRMLWYHFRVVPVHPEAQHGVIDLRYWKFSDRQVIDLNGEWEFYPNLFLEPGEEDGLLRSPEAARKWIKVPGKWNQVLGKDSGYGYGTYRIRVLTGKSESLFGLRVQNVQTSSRIYLNGEMKESTGDPSITPELNRALNIPYTVLFKSDSGVMDIVIHVSNYQMHSTGGITQSVKFGTAEAVTRETSFSETMQIIVCVVLLLHVLYACILFFLGNRGKELAYFSATVFFAIISILIDDDKLLLVWFPFDFDWTIKIKIAIYSAIPAFLILCMKSLLGSRGLSRVITAFLALCSVNVLLAICLPIQLIIICRYLLLLIMLSAAVIVPVLVLEIIRRGEKAAIFILLSAVALSNNMLISGGIKANFWPDMPYYPFDLIVTFLGLASFWFIRFSQITISSQKMADQLRKADKLKDDFLANTSHELRNPLHGMINMAQTVLEKEKNGLQDSSRGNLQLIVTVGQRMSLLLNDLLDITLLRERDIVLNKQSVDLGGVVTGVFDMLAYLTEGKSVELVQNVPKSFPRVIADENRLVQIIFNLLHNAIKYTENGIIAVEAEIRDGKALIRVKDSGIGMDEETRRRIFLPYEQGEGGLAGAGGIGLGLSICKQLVELHGGTLEVVSSPGQGSEFTFTLEVDDRPEQQSKEREAFELVAMPHNASGADGEYKISNAKNAAWKEDINTSYSDKPRILAVDDDPINLKILSNILSTDNYDIVCVFSGKEAMELLDGGEWDLVIADVMMPQMSGYELTRTIRIQYGITDLPILLLTARSRPEDVYAGFAAGANDYVTKPVGSLDLKARVHALIHLRHTVSERLRLEAAWLQAQIRPHFLFNTLNSIASLSDSDPVRMTGLLEEFGTYLRMSFNPRNLQRLIPLEQELELTRSYLYIEKERFGDRLGISWEIPDSVTAEVPPLSLQPLVENAVRHGIFPRASGGTVKIIISDRTEEWIIVTVQDDGVGIGKEKLDRLISSAEPISRGIGLVNTDRRLKQIYGQGLKITSILGKGTTVSFKIPKQTGRKEPQDKQHNNGW